MSSPYVLLLVGSLAFPIMALLVWADRRWTRPKYDPNAEWRELSRVVHEARSDLNNPYEGVRVVRRDR